MQKLTKDRFREYVWLLLCYVHSFVTFMSDAYWEQRERPSDCGASAQVPSFRPCCTRADFVTLAGRRMRTAKAIDLILFAKDAGALNCGGS